MSDDLASAAGAQYDGGLDPAKQTLQPGTSAHEATAKDALDSVRDWAALWASIEKGENVLKPGKAGLIDMDQIDWSSANGVSPSELSNFRTLWFNEDGTVSEINVADALQRLQGKDVNQIIADGQEEIRNIETMNTIALNLAISGYELGELKDGSITVDGLVLPSLEAAFKKFSHSYVPAKEEADGTNGTFTPLAPFYFTKKEGMFVVTRNGVVQNPNLGTWVATKQGAAYAFKFNEAPQAGSVIGFFIDEGLNARDAYDADDQAIIKNEGLKDTVKGKADAFEKGYGDAIKELDLAIIKYNDDIKLYEAEVETSLNIIKAAKENLAKSTDSVEARGYIRAIMTEEEKLQLSKLSIAKLESNVRVAGAKLDAYTDAKALLVETSNNFEKLFNDAQKVLNAAKKEALGVLIGRDESPIILS